MNYEKVSDKEWEEIILKSNNAYFFSSPTWAKILEKSFDEYHCATRLYHINDKSILIPMMEKNTQNILGSKFFESMPMGPGGLFSESEITPDEFKGIINDIIRTRHIFLLTLPPFDNPFKNYSLSTKPNKKIDEWNIKDDEWNYMHILDLEGKDFEDIWKNYQKRTRNSIRKAIKSGVEIREGTTLNDYKTFYNIWSKASQNWENQETYSFKFFQNLHKYGSPHIKLSLATKDNKTIAGLIAFHYSKTIFLIFSAFIKEYGEFNPTRLIYNESIKQACQEEYKYINFGPGKLEGLRRVKEGFRAELIETKRYLAVANLTKILDKINIT